ncbi:MAG: UDP-N-acetylmuramoyl-tripeptide--D-alanyl-D-alanine ligase [Oscillospiraceae bacterium]|nr:UDP-N-acetylmuramoyl-tripeptide--D-alanyl-D-alanine ligase [Oscillospiraceae bacterium]
MGRITLRQAADWCSGRIDPKYADVTFLGANNDSRNIQPGQLFIALEGERDGHAFIPMAMEKGAAAVLCRHCEGDYPAIVVEDPRIALGDIAREERRRIGMKVVGVTGSVGKSTTKEMIACVLDGSYRIGKTPVNHNNDIGMPMAVLAMSEDTEVAVLEMGMNHFREIAYLASIALPDVAVIINIGTMHIEHLGSQEGILKAKLEILEGMKTDGKVILNGDDALLRNVHRKSSLRVTYFGVMNPDCDVRASDVTQTPGQLTFTVNCGNQSFSVELAMEGEHYVPDALAAVSVGLAMGVSPVSIRERLASFRNLAGRQEILQVKGYTIIKDCYNAGPESMAAALTVLGNKPGRHIAVLGDMLELGVCTQAEHYRIGRIAAEKADMVLAYGPNSSRIINGALTGGMPNTRAMAFEDRDQLVAALKRLAKPGDVMLFKGSHGMHMELALEKFLKDET